VTDSGWIVRTEREPQVWPARIATGVLLALSVAILVFAF
jgi:hypothetical protein